MDRYKIFPDYCSTGAWKQYKNTDGTWAQHFSSELPDYVPEGLKIALKYWHDVWEFLLVDGDVMSVRYISEWYINGQKIVNELNRLGIDEYVYEIDAVELKDLAIRKVDKDILV